MGTVAIEQYIGLVHFWARVYKRMDAYHGIDHDDLVQEGFCGLLYAQSRYDPNRHSKFSTYASGWIRRNIKRVEKQHRDHRSTIFAVSHLEHTSVDSDDVLSHSINSEKQTAIFDSLSTLDARSREIISSRFGIGRSKEPLRDIAARFGISQERVRQIERRSLERLRRNPAIRPYAPMETQNVG